MATAKELITLAASQIGVKESPSGSNKVKYWDFYKERTGVNYQGNPWCAAFVAYCMKKVGIWKFNSDKAMFRYCPSLVDYAKEKKRWIGRDGKPKAGDIVLFASGNLACHVGIVEKVISSTKIQTIEGNTSVTSNDNGGSVMRRTREYGTSGSSWYILGFYRPGYKSSNKYIIKKEGLYVWSAPKKGSKKLKRLKKGQKITVVSTTTADGNVWASYVSSVTGKTRYFKIKSTNGKKVYAEKC